MLALLWLGVIVIVAVAATLFVLQQQGVILAGKKSKELPSLERNIFNLQIGDIVQYMGRDWVVEGKLNYNVGGYIWFEYLLQDHNDIRWLSVDEDDRVEVAFLEPTDRLEVSKNPPKQLNFADETYHRVDSGMAKMTRVGTTLRKTAERCEYFDYRGSDDNVLSIEIWDGEVEVTVGYQINPRSLTLLPGDGRRVYGV
ncbi:DUF4178 domain-containing protein [Mastigocoleus sp. MO_188.B34]|uniref:DUF4178 domain-containing protein n=1 Tax=Mastigocoleus sp. MO_188.B34 TaxID=3036635 RepID=UPI0026137624|nr:DUF4178 domain-containing protein [Mastigocoleus sp. MO_188.B34]MDJ0696442.1 DUF4178 domain-containing protein [Mastigocoleus sp. MO_188.B34]